MAFEATKNFRKKATSDTTDTGSNAAMGRFEATSNFRRNEAYAQRRYNEMERQVNDIISRYNGIIKQAQEYTSGGEKKSAAPNIRYRAGDTIGVGNDYTDFSTAYSLGRSAAKLRKEASELMSAIQDDYGSGNAIEKLAAVQILNSIANESFDDEINNEYIGRMPYTSYNVRKQALRQYLDDKKIEKKYGVNDDTSAIELIGKAEGITVPKAAAERQEASADAKKAYSEEKSRIEKEYGITLSYDDYEENVLKLQELMKTLPAGEEKQRVLDFSKIDPTIYNYKMTAGGSDTPTAEEKKKQQKFEATERTGYNYIEADRDTLQKEKDYLRYLASQRITMDDWNAINEGEAYTDDVARDYKVSALNNLKNNKDFKEKSNISEEQKSTFTFSNDYLSGQERAANVWLNSKFDDNYNLIQNGNAGVATYDEIVNGMTDDEVKVFNYLINTEGIDAAAEYRELLNSDSEFQESIGSRKGKKFYDEHLKGHPIKTALYSVSAGFTGQYLNNLEGIGEMLTGDMPTPRDQTEIYAVENAKADSGRIGKTVIDLGTNLGDNLPGNVIGWATGNTGSALSIGLTAASAAYAQARNEGYTAKEAQEYAAITGASEALLEKLLGGIAGMTGKITGKTAEAAIKNIEKAGLRMLAEGTIDMAGEFTEEYLQEILDPVFRNITLDENNEFKPFTADALYAGMLGALSAATMNAVPLTVEAASYAKNKAQRAAGAVRTGQELIGTEAAQQMVELGKEIGKDRLVEKATADVKERRGLGKIVQFVEKTKKAAANGKLAESVVTDTLRKAESVASEELTQRLGDLGQKKDVVVTMALAMAANDTDTQDAMNALIIQSLSAEEYQKTIAAVGETADVLHKKTNIEQVAKVNDSIDRGDYDMENIPLTSQEIKAVRRDGDGNITYIGGDGQEVSSEDVKISAELKYFYEKYAAKLPEADAEEMITAFKKSKLPDYAAPYFAAEWKNAREMGRLGVSSKRLSEVEMNLDLDTITKDYIKKAAYAQGLKERAKAVHLDNVQKKAEKIIQNRRSGKAEGEVRGTDTLHKSQDKRSAKNVLRIAEVLAKLGYDIEFYSGKKTTNGVEVGDTVNGAYDASTHTIYLRADASYLKRVSLRGILGFTLAHELTHSLKAGDLKGYQELVEYITASLGTKTFENLMSRYMYTQDGKENMKYSAALDEVVANACEKMLENSKALEKLAMENAPLYLKIGEKLKNLIRRIRNSLKGMYSDVDSLHPETAELMKALGDRINEFQQMYDRVLYDSITNMRKALAEAENAKTRENLDVLEKQAEKEGLQLSEEIGDRYADYDKPITVYDVEVLRSIGRKSINSFTSEDIQKAAKWAYKFYKELGTKSPFFRAWFGDWRAKDTTAAKMIDTEGDLRSPSEKNEDTGWEIIISRQVSKETTHHSSDNVKNAVKYLPYIKDITQNAVLLDTYTSGKDNSLSLFFHSMYAYTEVMGYPALIKLKVEELINEKDGSSIRRDYILQNIEEKPISEVKRFSKALHHKKGFSEYRVSQLYSLVKRFDKDFSAGKSVDPVLLNKDGTPKVLYHYTDNVFSIFDISRSGANQGKSHGDGIYLSSNPNEFSYAGKNRMQLYASIANPFEMQLSKAEAEKIYDKYFKPFHKDTYNTYKPHVIEKLQSPTRVFDYLNEAAEKNNIKTSDILGELGYDGVHDGPEWVAFKETQVKSATDNIGTFDKGNKDIRYSEEISERDAEYLNLAKDPKKNAAQLRKLVDDAAKAAGFAKRLYHGTKGFGSTQVDTGYSDDGISFFMSDDERVTSWYSGTDEKKPIGKNISENGANNYEFYANTDNMYEIDDYGAQWDNILDADALDSEDAINKAFPESEGFTWDENDGFLNVYRDDVFYGEYVWDDESDRYVPNLPGRDPLPSRADGFGAGTTRSLSRAIYDSGKYSGVIFRKIHDAGFDNGNSYADIYNFFHPESQVKSADLVTYDDNGDIIPLSERFNTEKNELRFSEEIETSRDTLVSDEAYTAADWRRDAAEAMEFVAKTDTEKAFALMYADAVREATDAEAEIKEINAKLREAKKPEATNEQLESIGRLTEQKKQALERKREAGEKLIVYQKYGTYTKLMARAEKTNMLQESVTSPMYQSYAARRRDAAEAEARRALLTSITKRSNRIIGLASDNSRTKHIPTTQKELIGRLGLGTEINTLTRTALLADQRERMLVSIADAENRLAKYRDDLKRYTERKNNMLEKLKGNLTEKQRANAESSVEYYEQFEGRRTVQIEAAEKQIENFRKRLESLEASSRAMDEFTKNLYDIYESFKGESDKNGGSNAVYDTDIGEALKEFKDRNSGRSVLEMSTADLRSLDNLLAAVSASISNADKVFKAGRNATVSGYAEQVRGEVGTAEKSVKDNRFSQAVYSAGEWIKKQLFKPAERFKQTGSGTLYKMYRRLQHGEGDYARSVIKYGKFFKDQIEKYGIKEADLGKKITETVTDTRYVDGKATKEYKQVTLTVGQIMTMYGLSLRKLGLQHLVAENGGFRLEGKRLLTEKAYIVNAKAFTLDADGVHTLTSRLSNEQKEFVKALQGYMSTEMAKDRNKVTLEMYDYEGATEKNYWPIITDSSYRVKNMEKKNDRSVQLKNIGSMKETNPMATSPVILQSIETLWANHANETALYSSFTLELENIKRVLDYEFENGDAVKRLLGDKQSEGLFDFLKMVNGGIRADDVGMMKLFNLYKAAKVGANMRVVIQQPTAIVRALALIDPKYLFGSFNTSKTLTKDMGMKLEEEAMEYTSTYGIKSLGGIDIGTKGSLSEQLSDFGKNKSTRKKVESFKEKAFYGLAEQADRVTWLNLWNACKREQHDLHPELSGEALLKAAGERFDEITNETQVYDSVFSRARILSSESSYARMLTSFFAEPLTTLNMAIEGVSQIVKGNAKKGARYLASVAGAIVLTNMFSSVFDALRDDDDDQSFGEKYVEALLSSLINDFNPAAYIPFYRDLLNIIQGYDAKRADMQLVSDIINRTKTIVAKWDTEKGIRNFAELWQQEVKLGSNILDALGIPMTNIWRDGSALLRLPETLKIKATKTGWKSAMEDFKTEVPFYGWRKKGMKTEDKLYYATLNKDSAYLERAVGNLTEELEGKGKSKKEIRSAIDQKIKKGLQDNDLRIAAAAQARIEGDTEEYLSCVKAVVNDGFTEKQTVSAILALENELNGDDEGVDRYISGIPYTKTDIQRELEAGNTAPLEEFYAQKFTEKSAEDDVKNPAKEARQAAANMLGNIYSEPYKRAYDDGDTDECERITELLLDVEIEGYRLLKYKTIVGWKDKKLSDDKEEEE